MIAAASGAARKDTANATSSGSSSLPSGDAAAKAASAEEESRPVRSWIRATDVAVMSVRTNAGHTAFAVTPVAGQLRRDRPHQVEAAACFDAV